MSVVKITHKRVNTRYKGSIKDTTMFYNIIVNKDYKTYFIVIVIVISRSY